MLGPYFMSYKYNSSTCLILHLEFTDKSFKINMNWKNYNIHDCQGFDSVVFK